MSVLLSNYPVSLLWYKKRVRNFFKNVFLPTCAGIVILILFAPYFHQHLKLMVVSLVATLGIGLLVALRIEKLEKADSKSLFAKLDYIRQIFETNKSDQEKVVVEKQHFYEMRQRLADFLKQGKRIEQGIIYNDAQSINDKTVWEKEVGEYLASQAEESFAVRFQSCAEFLDITVGDSRKRQSQVIEMHARLALLGAFISELHR